MNTATTLIALVLGAATTAGCATPGGPLYVDSRFSKEELAEVQAAADMWTAAGAPVDIVPGAHTTCLEGGRRELCRYGHRGAVGIDKTFLRGDVDATTLDGRLIVDMDRVAETGDSLTAVVAHEMGHMLGLEHTDVTPALMNTRRGPESPVTLTAADLSECGRVGAGCGQTVEVQVSP